jgi:hypothetical protein
MTVEAGMERLAFIPADSTRAVDAVTSGVDPGIRRRVPDPIHRGRSNPDIACRCAAHVKTVRGGYPAVTRGGCRGCGLVHREARGGDRRWLGPGPRARQLTAQGCSVAACDLSADAVAETAVMARADARPGVRVSVHHCDVSDEARVLRFRDELLAEHATDHVDLVFSNAGIGGGESFIGGSRQVWERVFAVDWCGDLADPHRRRRQDPR